jgi:hypothetical protein
MKESTFDKYYPFIGGAIVAIAYIVLFIFHPQIALAKGFRDIFIASITINAIAVGFLATAKSILISIHNSKIVKWMKETGAYEITINYFMTSLTVSILCALWSMVLLLIDFSNPEKYIEFGIAVWVFLFISAMLAMYRIIRIFSKILRKA